MNGADEELACRKNPITHLRQTQIAEKMRDAGRGAGYHMNAIDNTFIVDLEITIKTPGRSHSGLNSAFCPGEALYEAVRSLFLAGYAGAIVDEVPFGQEFVRLSEHTDPRPRAHPMSMRISRNDSSRSWIKSSPSIFPFSSRMKRTETYGS